MTLSANSHVLSKMDAATIITSIFASWFIGSYLAQHDWVYALGSALWSLLIGFAVVGTFNRRRTQRHQATMQEQVNHALDLSKDPETPWVEILKTAKTQMPAEEYEKFERAVLNLAENIGVVNRTQLKTQAKKMALLEKLTNSSADSHD